MSADVTPQEPAPMAEMFSALDADAKSAGCAEPIASFGTIRTLAEFEQPKQNDPNELLKNRFLCRTGGLLLVAPSGIGKSAYVTQVALCWSIGKPALGIDPARPLRILIIQAENDDGDLAEMRDGVIQGMTDSGVFTAEEAETSAKSVRVMRCTTITGEGVGPLIRQHANDCDLVIIDPLFSFIGGDVMQARDTSHFLREVLNPVAEELNIGIMLVHHTTKPPKGQDRYAWQAGELAYLGAGSSELTNWARAVLAIRSRGDERVFELVAPKRGRRLGWTDANGQHATSKLISHSNSGICWIELSPDEAADFERQSNAMASKPTKVPLSQQVDQATEMVFQKAWTKSALRIAAIDSLQTSASNFDRKILPALREMDGVAEATAHKGKAPVHLIGTLDAVNDEKARIEADWAAAQQKTLSLK